MIGIHPLPIYSALRIAHDHPLPKSLPQLLGPHSALPASHSRLCSVVFPRPSTHPRQFLSLNLSRLRQMHAAVYVQDVAGNVTCLIARQEHDCGRHISRLSHAP